MLENLAAGAVNQVGSRTADLLPVVIAAAEILGDVDPAARQAELVLRLELGIPRDLIDLAGLCRGRLTRAEYLHLRAAGLGTLDALANTSANQLAEHFGGSEARAKAVLELVRAANEAAAEAE